MKPYNPPTYYCALCGRMLITRNPSEYVFKRRDNRRESQTFGKTLYFCSNSCMTKYERTYPGRGRYGGR